MISIYVLKRDAEEVTCINHITTGFLWEFDKTRGQVLFSVLKLARVESVEFRNGLVRLESAIIVVFNLLPLFIQSRYPAKCQIWCMKSRKIENNFPFGQVLDPIIHDSRIQNSVQKIFFVGAPAVGLGDFGCICPLRALLRILNRKPSRLGGRIKLSRRTLLEMIHRKMSRVMSIKVLERVVRVRCSFWAIWEDWSNFGRSFLLGWSFQVVAGYRQPQRPASSDSWSRT